jgi:tetratricopeptide (TPR) repeat protein
MNESTSHDTRFEKLIAFLIASAAILVAITLSLQNYASSVSAKANRAAQELAIGSTTTEIRGAIQFSYDWQSAFQTWNEIHLQQVAADQTGNTKFVDRYTKLEEKFVPLTPLLSEPYFDTERNWPSTAKYASDLYIVEATRLQELYQANAEVGRAWSNIAEVFVIQITLLTVALSLYGLSITLRGRVRWLFVFVGAGLVLFCMLWMAKKLIEPKPTISEEAINAYAEGYGLSYQEKYKEAVASFDKALAIRPDYGNAMYERGFNYLSMNDYEHAISDFLGARQLGVDGEYTYWNLAWAYYLMGRYEDAISANNVILDSDPSVIGMRMNQGLTYLANGDLDQARREYDTLIEEVQHQIADAHAQNQQPSASLWYYMDAASIDLQNLVDQLDGKPKDWTEAPEVALIRGDQAQIKAFALEQITRLKEATLALEYTGQLPPAQEVMSVSPFAFGSITKKDEQGYVAEFDELTDATFPQYTPSVDIQFTYSGPTPTKQIMWKVFHNGVEDASFRSLWDPNLSGSDTWYKTVGYNYTNIFVLSPGEYVVELYVDYHLVQTGTFYVAEE